MLCRWSKACLIRYQVLSTSYGSERKVKSCMSADNVLKIGRCIVRANNDLLLMKNYIVRYLI